MEYQQHLRTRLIHQWQPYFKDHIHVFSHVERTAIETFIDLLATKPIPELQEKGTGYLMFSTYSISTYSYKQRFPSLTIFYKAFISLEDIHEFMRTPETDEQYIDLYKPHSASSLFRLPIPTKKAYMWMMPFPLENGDFSLSLKGYSKSDALYPFLSAILSDGHPEPPPSTGALDALHNMFHRYCKAYDPYFNLKNVAIASIILFTEPRDIAY
jgi:hypothetical protein